MGIVGAGPDRVPAVGTYKKWTMNELTPDRPARPMDREAMSNDMGMLKSLLGQPNNPAITGASQPQPEAKEEPAKAAAPQAQTEFQMSTKRIFFTGATKVGKSFLAAQVGARVFDSRTRSRP